MTPKGKLIRNGVIAAAALALLGGGYYLAVKWEPKAKDEQPAAAAETVSLIQEDSENVTSVHVKNPKEEYTIQRSEDGTYSIPERPGAEFSQSSLMSAFTSLLSWKTDREITRDLSRMGEFGLVAEDAVVTVTMKDGAEKAAVVGSEAPGGDYYYCMARGGDAIYTISAYKAQALMKTTDDFRNNSLMTIEANQVTSLKVQSGGRTALQVRSATEEDQPMNTVNPVWMMEVPWKEGVSSDRFGKLLESMVSLSAVSYVEDNPADLAPYGLANPAWIVEIGTAEQTYTIRMGNTTEEDGVYMQFGDSPAVFVADRTMYDAVKNMDAMEYVEKFVHIANIDNMAAVSVVKDGREYLMELDEEEDQSREDGEQEEKKTTYHINGEVAEEKAFKQAYQLIIGIMFVDRGDFPISGSPFMTVTYRFKDGRTDTMEYYAYDERYYVVKRSDGVKLTILKTTLDELFKTIDGGTGA